MNSSTRRFEVDRSSGNGLKIMIQESRSYGNISWTYIEIELLVGLGTIVMVFSGRWSIA